MNDLRDNESFKKLFSFSLVYMAIIIALWGSYLFYDNSSLKISGTDIFKYLVETKMALTSDKYLHHMSEEKKLIMCSYELMLPQLLAIVSCYIYHKKCSKLKDYELIKSFTKFIILMSFLILACAFAVGQYLYIQAKANSFKDKSTKVVKAGTYKIYKDTNYEEILASIYENKELDNFDYFIMNNKTNF